MTISSTDAFTLHDTFGFPIEMTIEIVAEHGLGVDEEGFETLMNDQRARARQSSGRGRAGEALRERGDDHVTLRVPARRQRPPPVPGHDVECVLIGKTKLSAVARDEVDRGRE